MLRHPSTKDFEGMAWANLIANGPMTPENTSHAHQLFGEKFAGLREKTVNKKLEQVVKFYVMIPRDVLKTNKCVTLTANVMLVNNLPFVITQRREIGLVMAELCLTEWQIHQHST